MTKKRGGARKGAGRPKGARSSKQTAQQIAVAEQATRALAMCRQGWSYAAIGEAMGVSKTRAFEIVDKALREAAEDRRKGADTIIDLELQRLNEMTAGLAPAAERGDVNAVTAMLAVMARRARYLGVDAPTKTEVSGPNGSPVESRVVVEDAARSFDVKATKVLEKVRKSRETKGE